MAHPACAVGRGTRCLDQCRDRISGCVSTVRKKGAVPDRVQVGDGADEPPHHKHDCQSKHKASDGESAGTARDYLRRAIAVTKLDCGDITADFTSAPRSTSTKLDWIGNGTPGKIKLAVPVQSALTSYVPLAWRSRTTPVSWPFALSTCVKLPLPSYVWRPVADAGPAPGRPYDLSPDGRFLMIKENAANEGRATPASITVVQNWLEELKRLVPAK
jgi:hypothetical protein